jgi:phage tail-like protein
MPPTGSRYDPFTAFNFRVKIDGINIQAAFSECSGLTSETDHIEYRTGDEDITARKVPGQNKFANLVFKRGYTSSTELWQWRKNVVNGQVVRCSGSITLLDEARNPALEWKFREGWPCKLEGPTFNAKNNEVAIETLEICHEGLELA